MSVVIGGDVSKTLGEWREDDHADRPVEAAAGAFVPGYEERAAIRVGGRGENSGHLSGKPVVAVANSIGGAATCVVVAVMTEVWDDEIVAGNGVIRQVGGQLRVRTD